MIDVHFNDKNTIVLSTKYKGKNVIIIVYIVKNKLTISLNIAENIYSSDLSIHLATK